MSTICGTLFARHELLRTASRSVAGVAFASAALLALASAQRTPRRALQCALAIPPLLSLPAYFSIVVFLRSTRKKLRTEDCAIARPVSVIWRLILAIAVIIAFATIVTLLLCPCARLVSRFCSPPQFQLPCLNHAAAQLLPESPCPICLDDVRGKHTCKLKCEHLFHRPCIEQWVARNANCPNCRTPVDRPTRKMCGSL